MWSICLINNWLLLILSSVYVGIYVCYVDEVRAAAVVRRTATSSIAALGWSLVIEQFLGVFTRAFKTPRSMPAVVIIITLEVLLLHFLSRCRFIVRLLRVCGILHLRSTAERYEFVYGVYRHTVIVIFIDICHRHWSFSRVLQPLFSYFFIQFSLD